MKKIAKSATLAVALVSCASIALPAFPVVSVFADTGASSSVVDVKTYLEVPNFKGETYFGKPYTIAQPTINKDAGDTTEYTTDVKVLDPAGEEVTEIEENIFSPDQIGTYKIVYSLLNGSEVVETKEVPLVVFENNYLQVESFVATGNVDVKYTFAKANIKAISGETDDSTIKIDVTDPFGDEVDLDGNNSFTPSIAGTYKVVYSLRDSSGNVLATSEFKLNIAGISTEYTLSAPVNSKNIVPSTVNTKDGDNGTVVTLPSVEEVVIKDADGKVLTYQEIKDAGMDIVIATPTANKSGVAINWDGDTRKLTVDKQQTSNVEYTAVYNLVKKAVAPQTEDIKLANLKISFVANPDYNAPTNYVVSTADSKPTSAEVGIETKLPSFEAKSKEGNEPVAIYYTIKITHTNSISSEAEEFKPEDTDNDVITFKDGGFVFTPRDTGSYVVYYDIKDFKGNSPEGNGTTTTFSIKDVKQNTQATPKFVLPYTGEGKGVDAKEGFNEVQDSKNIMILPIDADDKANGYIKDANGKENNLTLYRQIWDTSNDSLVFDEREMEGADPTKALIFNKDGEKGFVTKTVWVNGLPNVIEPTNNMIEAVNKNGDAVTLEVGKSYVVKYFAKNKLAKIEASMDSVPLKIVEGFVGSDAKPTVTFDSTTTLPSSANLGDKITFKAPTAKQITDEVNQYTHTNLTTYIKYQLKIGNEWEKETGNDKITRYDATGSWITLSEDKKEYTLKIDETRTDVTAIKIFACSTNDLGNTEVVERVISIVGTGDDGLTTIKSVAVATNGAEKPMPYKAMEGQKVILPSVTYNDDLPQFLNVKIVIDGDEKAYNGAYEFGNGEVTYSGAYFVPTEARTYTISYISTDAGRNKTIMTFALDVEPDASNYWARFEETKSSINGGKAKVGEKVSIPAVSVSVSHPDDLIADDWYVDIQGLADIETDHKTYVIFNEAGTYSIQYVCKVHNKVGSPEFNDTITYKVENSIEVTVEKGPVVQNALAVQESFDNIGTLKKEDNYTIKFVKVIPTEQEQKTVYALLPQAFDADLTKSTLSVVASGLTLKTINLDDTDALSGENGGVKLNRDDVFQFTYTLKDASGNTTTLETYKIDVGNVEPPEIEVKNGAVIVDGNKVKIDFSKITVKDTDENNGKINIITHSNVDRKYILADGYELKITLVGTNDSKNKTITSSDTDNRGNLEGYFQFTDVTADEYTFKISVTDPTGKQTTDSSLTFKVSADNPSPISGEDVLGIVLIVVSVVVLAGVVTYFVVTRKKSKGKF